MLKAAVVVAKIPALRSLRRSSNSFIGPRVAAFNQSRGWKGVARSVSSFSAPCQQAFRAKRVAAIVHGLTHCALPSISSFPCSRRNQSEFSGYSVCVACQFWKCSLRRLRIRARERSFIVVFCGSKICVASLRQLREMFCECVYSASENTPRNNACLRIVFSLVIYWRRLCCA